MEVTSFAEAEGRIVMQNRTLIVTLWVWGSTIYISYGSLGVKIELG